MLVESWKILCQLAPWLLLGMLLSGLMHVLLPDGFIRRKFQGASGVVKAVLLGVPLPLCSCGVVPAGIGIKNQGASDGAAVGFLISTPQTGVDSILVSASFFGWPFAIFKMVAAAITGVVGGLLADRNPESLNESQIAEASEQSHNHVSAKQPVWLQVWLHGLEIVRSIWIWLIIGILISAVINVYIPNEWFAVVSGMGLLSAMLVVLMISLPLYVCATASVPIAAALVNGGLPPAAALVFLMAGPATNIATIGAILSRFGRRTLLVYLTTIVVGSMVAAWLFDWLLTANVSDRVSHDHDHDHWWSVLSGLVLLSMIGWFLWSDARRWFERRTQRVETESEIEMVVDGMTCGSCVNRLESALRKSEGIKSVHVQLDPGLVRVSGDVDRDLVRRIVETLGFTVRPSSVKTYIPRLK